MYEWGQVDVEKLSTLILVSVIDDLIADIYTDALTPGFESNGEAPLS